MMRKQFLALIPFLLLGACDSPSDKPPPKLFESQRQALDKAKALEGEMQQDAKERAKLMQQQVDPQQSSDN